MRLVYSDGKRVPVIHFENGSRLIFSVTTETEKGFKYLAFNGKNTMTATVSGARAKKKKIKRISELVSFMVDTSIKRPGKSSLPNNAKDVGLSKITVALLRKTFKFLVDDEGYFPRENLSTLKVMLDKINGCESDTWDHDPTINWEDEDE